MVLTSPEHSSYSYSSSSGSGSCSSKRPTLGFLVSMSTLVALCAKHASRVSSKLKSTKPSQHHHHHHDSFNRSLKSPLTRPKQFLTQISNKALTFVHGNKKRVGEEHQNEDVGLGPEDFGDGGVWQRAILMGDKCQPLNFSGVIYYDSTGKQLNEVPLRSPRASPLPGYLTRVK